MYMYLVGFMNEKPAAYWRSVRLKFIFGRFSMPGAQTTTMVTEALMAQPKGFICTCALIFIVYFFVCFMQNNVELKVLWRTQTFSHEIDIKSHSLKCISRLEQTNNLISKLIKLRYWKNTNSLDHYKRKIQYFFRKCRSEHRRRRGCSSFMVVKAELGLFQGLDKQWNITRSNFALCFYLFEDFFRRNISGNVFRSRNTV